MIAEQLRRSLLQAAIQGKLTEQLDTDGDARDLLKEIKIEKDRLTKEGKIKKDKPLPEITEDEIPFEIPNNWCWVRIGDIARINPRNNIDDEKIVSFIPMTLLNDGYSNSFTHEKSVWKNVKSGFTHFSNNDVIVAKITPCFQNRKSAVMRDLFNGFGAGTTELHVIRPISSHLLSNYLLFFFKTDYFIADGVLSMTGTAGQQRVGKEYIQNILFPFPPLAEQKRIVEALNEFISEIAELEKLEIKVETLQESFPRKMKDSILQAAITGKLTEQMESDGDARDLLKEIKIEKDHLIKEGKIKKDKPIPVITEDEIPFDIPENWCWVRLADIGEIIGGGTPKTEEKRNWQNGDIPWLTPADMKNVNGKYVSRGERNISNYGLSHSSAQLLPKGSVVFSSRAPIGYIAITNNALCTNQGFKSIVPYRLQMNEYIYYFLMSFTQEIIKHGSGTTFKEVSGSVMKNIIFPLPPISEQFRIVERLNRLLPLCDSLE